MPLEGQGAPPPVPGTVIEDTTPQPQDQPGRPRTARDRIAQLTGRYRAEQQKTGALESQLSQVLDVMKAQGEELKELRGTLARPPTGAAVPQDKGDDILGLAGANPNPRSAEATTGGVPMTPDTLRAVMAETIAAYDQNRRQQESVRERLITEQELSFGEAVQEIPSLNDKRSKAFQVFSEIYETSPLRNLSDGPYQVALQVKGILASEQPDAVTTATPQQAHEDRLRHAALPQQSSTPQVPEAGRAALQKRYGLLSAEIKRGNEDYNVYREWRMLREQLRNTR